MNERAKIITELAFALPRDEREALYHALAESLGRPDTAIDEARWMRPRPPCGLLREAAVTLG